MQTDSNLCDCERCSQRQHRQSLPLDRVRVRQMIRILLVASCLRVCEDFSNWNWNTQQRKWKEREKKRFLFAERMRRWRSVLIPPNNNKYCTVFPSRAPIRHSCIVHTIALFLVHCVPFYIRRWHRRLLSPHPNQTRLCSVYNNGELDLRFLFLSRIASCRRAYFCIACSVYRSCMSCLSGWCENWTYTASVVDSVAGIGANGEAEKSFRDEKKNHT